MAVGCDVVGAPAVLPDSSAMGREHPPKRMLATIATDSAGGNVVSTYDHLLL